MHSRLPARTSAFHAILRILTAAAAVLLLASAGAGPAEARTGYPKVQNGFIGNLIRPADIPVLAKWDVLTLDADFPYENPGVIEQIRALNPDIVILAYLPMNGAQVVGQDRPHDTVLYQSWKGMNDGNFWLYDAVGNHVGDWDGKWDTNLTADCPRNAQGQNFAQWFPQFVYDVVWQQGNSVWDGINLDNVWSSISWLNSTLVSAIDADRDGNPDNPPVLDAKWDAESDSLVARLRQLLGPDVPLVGNGPNHYYQDMNGATQESFPYLGPVDQNNPYQYAWRSWMFSNPYSYFNSISKYSASPMAIDIVNTFWPGDTYAPDTTDAAGFHRHLRFCLASTLLGDGYFSFDANFGEHNSIWWEPDYDRYIGTPTGPAYSYLVNGQEIWRRDYTGASILVNANNAALAAQGGLPAVGAWDAYIGDPITAPPPPDTIPPANITGYTAVRLDPTTFTLKWVGVGDDSLSGQVADYDVRWSTERLTDGPTWDNATRVPYPGPVGWPKAWESATAADLPPSSTLYFAVKAVDEAGNWSKVNGIYYRLYTLAADTDLVAPAQVTDLTLDAAASDGASFHWTAPGDDGTVGTAAAYEARWDIWPISDGSWLGATLVPGMPAPAPAGTVQQASVTGLPPGARYYVALRARDETGNYGAISNVINFMPTGTAAGPDTTGPAAVGDLRVASVADTTLDLAFTAPPDDQGTVVRYQLRYVAGTSFPDASWSAASAVPTPTPSSPGSPEAVTVGGLDPGGAYAFRIRSLDDASNWSELSAATTGSTVSTVVPDTTGPAAIPDLRVVAAGADRLTLAFTAPADQQGPVSGYELRYLQSASFPDASWASATPAAAPAPAAPGTAQSVTVTGLSAVKVYSFRIRSEDDAANWSPLSPAAAGTTQAVPPPPSDTTPPGVIYDLTLLGAGTDWLQVGFTAPSDGEGTVTNYDLRYLAGDAFPDSSWNAAGAVPTTAPRTRGEPESFRVPGLAPGSGYCLRIRARDNSGNWSVPGPAVTGTTLVPPDTTGPAAIADLRVTGTSTGSVDLAFTAPADDRGSVAGYELRYRPGTTFSDSAWSGAAVAPAPAPLAPGSAQTVRVSGLLSASQYTFRIRSTDPAGNLSALGAPATGATLAVPDLTPPAAVTDLHATVVDTFLVRLTWTAPGDDGMTGRAAGYDLRWRTDTLTAATWTEASALAGLPVPAAAGTPETLMVAGLPADRKLALAVIAADDAGNRGAFGNVAAVTLVTPLPPDTQPPSVPGGLAAAPRPGKVSLLWSAAAEPDFSHYRIYRGRLAAAPLDLYRDGVQSPSVDDDQVVPGRRYCYAVSAVDASGNESARSAMIEVQVPQATAGDRPRDFLDVGQVYPNPSPGAVALSVESGSAAEVSVEVYDIAGRRVRYLPRVAVPGGSGVIRWDGADDAGRRVGRGIYFMRVRSGDRAWTRKIQILP